MRQRLVRAFQSGVSRHLRHEPLLQVPHHHEFRSHKGPAPVHYVIVAAQVSIGNVYDSFSGECWDGRAVRTPLSDSPSSRFEKTIYGVVVVFFFFIFPLSIVPRFYRQNEKQRPFVRFRIFVLLQLNVIRFAEIIFRVPRALI